MIEHHHRQFFGSTTVGERGQVVVPAEAREKLGIKKGEKLLVFGVHNQTLVLTRLSGLKRLQEEMDHRRQEVEDILKKL